MDERIKHLINIFLLAVITLTFLYPWLNTAEHHSGDIVLYYLPRVEFLKQSIVEYSQFAPLWTPYYMGGASYAGKPISPTFNYILGSLLLVMPTALGAIKYSIILGIILAGIFMYILTFHLLQDKKAAFLSAIVYMFNGYVIENIIHSGWMVFAYTYPLIPLLVYFSFKAISKKYVFYSVLAGIVLALMIHAGAGIIFLYSTQIFAIFLLSKVSLSKQKLLKIALIAGIAITVAFCLSAFKLFPVQEYMKVSSRNLSYQESSGRAETLAHLVPSIISIVGIVPLGLILFGVYKGWKKKTIIFLVAVCLFSFLVSMRGPILYLVWKYYPSWQGMRYASRGMVLFAFAGSILAGAGLKEINEYVKNKSKKIALIHIVIILLTIISLLVLGKGPIRIGSDGKQYEYGNIDEMIKQNEVMQAISKMPGIFRMNVFETRGIDWGTEFYTVPLKLEPIFGYETAWLTEYMNEYLSLAYNDLPKFWGILNVKYITSKERINLTGFEMIGEYKPCSICFPSIPELAKAYGPYLFENKKFLPRAYIVNNGILVVGEKASAKDAMYSLMLHPAFDPSRSVIVLGKEKINQYDIGSLQRFSHVILTKGSVDGEDRILAEYKRKGGIILPDVLVGKNSISEEDVGRMFSTNSSFVPVADKNILTVNFDNKKIALEKEQSGFLVVSEQYSIYPGWGATVDGKPAEILRADGVISAVVLDNASKLTFEYKPKSLQLGVIISIIAAIAIAIYMIYFIYRNYEKKVQSNS